jgi:hypothetical protein
MYRWLCLQKPFVLEETGLTWWTNPETRVISFWCDLGLTTVFMFRARIVTGGDGRDACSSHFKKMRHFGVFCVT